MDLQDFWELERERERQWRSLCYHGFAVQVFGGLDLFVWARVAGSLNPKPVTALGLGVQCTTSGRV